MKEIVFPRYFLGRIFSPRYFCLKSPIPLVKRQMVDPLGSFTSHSFIGHQRNVPESMMPLQSCGFAPRTFFLLFWCSCCRRLCGCLSCLMFQNKQGRMKITNSSYRLPFSALLPPSVESLHLLRNLFFFFLNIHFNGSSYWGPPHRFLKFVLQSGVHWKWKRLVSAPKCQFTSSGQSLIQPLLELLSTV